MIHNQWEKPEKITYLKRIAVAFAGFTLLYVCVTSHMTWATYVVSDSMKIQSIQTTNVAVTGELFLISNENEVSEPIQPLDENGIYALQMGCKYQLKLKAVGNVTEGYWDLLFQLGDVSAYRYLSFVPSQTGETTEKLVTIIPSVDCNFSFYYHWESIPELGLEGESPIEIKVQSGEEEILLATISLGDLSLNPVDENGEQDDLNSEDNSSEIIDNITTDDTKDGNQEANNSDPVNNSGDASNESSAENTTDGEQNGETSTGDGSTSGNIENNGSETGIQGEGSENTSGTTGSEGNNTSGSEDISSQAEPGTVDSTDSTETMNSGKTVTTSEGGIVSEP